MISRAISRASWLITTSSTTAGSRVGVKINPFVLCVYPMADPPVQPAPEGQPRGLRLVSNQELDRRQAVDDAARLQQETDSRPNTQEYVGLAGYIRTQWNMMVRHRNTMAGWSDRLLMALRTFNGQYDPSKLAEIRKFGGSEVYLRLIAAKCRGASSLLRDVYLGTDRPWGLDPPEDPEVPDDIIAAIKSLIQTEVGTMQQAGQQTNPAQVKDR